MKIRQIGKSIFNFASSLALMSVLVMAVYNKDVWPRGTVPMHD